MGIGFFSCKKPLGRMERLAKLQLMKTAFSKVVKHLDGPADINKVIRRPLVEKNRLRAAHSS